mgnify:CR=1 FL=1
MTELYFQGDNKIKFSGFTEEVDGELMDMQGFQYWDKLPYGAKELRLEEIPQERLQYFLDLALHMGTILREQEAINNLQGMVKNSKLEESRMACFAFLREKKKT